MEFLHVSHVDTVQHTAKLLDGGAVLRPLKQVLLLTGIDGEVEELAIA